MYAWCKQGLACWVTTQGRVGVRERPHAPAPLCLRTAAGAAPSQDSVLGFVGAELSRVLCVNISAASHHLYAVQSCSWALSMTPKVGWGDSPTAAARPEGGTSQKATAGWLSMLSVFEPHWQVRQRQADPLGSRDAPWWLVCAGAAGGESPRPQQWTRGRHAAGVSTAQHVSVRGVPSKPYLPLGCALVGWAHPLLVPRMHCCCRRRAGVDG